MVAYKKFTKAEREGVVRAMTKMLLRKNTNQLCQM